MIGARILENGGNVADAAIATSAVLCVTQNNLCGLGGDMFALIRMNGKPVMDLNGSGRASKNATIEHFREKGVDKLPPRGEMAALTVPGIVDAWKTIHRDHATMEFKDLLEPAIKLARNGFPVTHNYHRSVEITARHLGEYGWGEVFTPGGKVPEIGSLFKQKDLAATLASIAEEGPETYYGGSLADRILKGLEGTGTLFESDDFRNHTTTLSAPLRTDYRGYDIYETNPNSQGATAILWLNLYELMEPEISNDAERKFQNAIRSGLLAYGERKLHITDPEYHSLPDGFCSKGYAEKVLASAPDFSELSGERVDPGDTTYFNLADSEGNSLSVIQSNYMGFGSGIVPRGTGFVLQNRGAYFSLDPEHHNALKPNKRTFHTLCAAMAEKDGEFQFSAGTMGGDIQPQIHFQMITGLIDEELDPQFVLDRPRWAFPHTIYERPGDMIVEASLYDALNGYGSRLLNLRKIDDLSSQTGHAQIVQRNNHGIVLGGSDPRGDGISISAL